MKFITSENLLEYLNVVLNRNMNKIPNKFPLLYLEVTRACNMKCKMCDIWRIKSNPKKELSTERILELVDEVADMGVKIITLFGGEPLIRKDLLKIIKKINETDIISNLDTNCFLMTEKKSKELYNVGLNNVSISLDGSRAEIHDYIRGVDGSFKKAIQGIKNLKKYKINLSVITVITKHNYKDLVNIIKLVYRLGVNSIRFIPMHISYPYNIRNRQLVALAKFSDKELIYLKNEISKIKELLKEYDIVSNSNTYFEKIPNFFKEKLKQNCFGGYAYCNIDCYGNVSPCMAIPTTCNINNKSFKEVWCSEDFNKLRQNVRKLQCCGCWNFSYVEPNLICQPLYLLLHFNKTLRMIKVFGLE